MYSIAPRAARPRTARVPLQFVIAAVVSPVLIVGCGHDKAVGPKPNPQPKYLDSSTPQNVLTNLKLSYASRDSAGYDSLFDAAYAGLSIDNNPPAATSFTKADELMHIGALARSQTITNIIVLFGGTHRFTDSADTLGWATVQVPTFLLQLFDEPTSFAVYSNASMEYKFRPTTPALGSPTDTTWKIVRWTEFAQ